MSIILGGLFLFGIVALVIFVLVKALGSRNKDGSIGGDLIAYGLMAIFIGGTVWALFLLGRAAFPGDSLVGMSQQDLAGALAGLIVAGPVSYILWRRQDDRRDAQPDSVTWSLYLAFTDLVYLTWLVVYLVLILATLFGEATDYPRVTDVLIIAAVVGIHDRAARIDRPGGSISQVYRVVGSAIGLTTLSIGVALVLWWLLERVYSTFAATAGDTPVAVGAAMAIVGGAVWAYKWLRPWRDSQPDGTFLTYVVLVLLASFSTLVGTLSAIVAITILFFTESAESAGAHFEAVSPLLAVATTAALIWYHHRPKLGVARTDAVRAYQYVLAAAGLGTAIGSFTTVITLVLRPSLVVTDRGTGVVVGLVAGAVGAVIWWFFWSEAQAAPRAAEAASTPRKFYVIGMAIILGLTATGAVIGVLLYTFQTLLGLNPSTTALVSELSLAVMAGGATWHLFKQNRADGELRGGVETRPYLVTVICSHPGELASLLPREASLRIIFRGDGLGEIDEDTAQRIVERTQGVDSIVWVGADSFEVVPALRS
jgi:hypothetical protein